MPVETICNGCARKLRVADEFAGRNARCPHCGTIYIVPQSTDSTAATTPFEPTAAAGDLWFVRTEDGTQYGPVEPAELEVWVGEGRVTANTQVRRKSEPHWHAATEYYPVLASAPPATQDPFAESQLAQTASPFAAPRARSTRPHRGGMILALGIIGLVCCQIAAPIAWGLGHADLAAIRAGQMDPVGTSITKAGMVLGIAGTLILLLAGALPFLTIAFN